jgi:endonuclease-3
MKSSLIESVFKSKLVGTLARDFTFMTNSKIEKLLDLLIKQYGARRLIPHYDPLTELVRTILSQNTSDVNSRPAFQALKEAFGSWQEIIQADTETVAELIKGGGLGSIKARRIQQALLEIQRRRGKLDLNFLGRMPVPEAREWLKQLPGVGDKTANCVLLFALGKPALPVDTHIFRVSKRLGLIQENASFEVAHQRLESMVPAENVYQFHVSMIEHGRRTCIARRPDCPQCVLNLICSSDEKLSGVPPKVGRG